MQAMNLLVFAGSARRDSLNRKLAAEVASVAKDVGAVVTHIELTDYELPLYHGDLEAQGMPPGVLRLKQVMDAHPGWIVVTPEYNGSYTPLLKNALDWASRPLPGTPGWEDGLRPFRGKVVGMLSASAGALGGLRAQSHLGPLLQVLKCWVAPQAFALSRADKAFDDQGRLLDPATRQQVEGVVRQVTGAAGRLQGL